MPRKKANWCAELKQAAERTSTISLTDSNGEHHCSATLVAPENPAGVHTSDKTVYTNPFLVRT